jgi:hypothetical protein
MKFIQTSQFEYIRTDAITTIYDYKGEQITVDTSIPSPEGESSRTLKVVIKGSYLEKFRRDWLKPRIDEVAVIEVQKGYWVVRDKVAFYAFNPASPHISVRMFDGSALGPIDAPAKPPAELFREITGISSPLPVDAS